MTFRIAKVHFRHAQSFFWRFLIRSISTQQNPQLIHQQNPHLDHFQNKFSFQQQQNQQNQLDRKEEIESLLESFAVSGQLNKAILTLSTFNLPQQVANLLKELVPNDQLQNNNSVAAVQPTLNMIHYAMDAAAKTNNVRAATILHNAIVHLRMRPSVDTFTRILTTCIHAHHASTITSHTAVRILNTVWSQIENMNLTPSTHILSLRLRILATCTNSSSSLESISSLLRSLSTTNINSTSLDLTYVLFMCAIRVNDTQSIQSIVSYLVTLCDTNSIAPIHSILVSQQFISYLSTFSDPILGDMVAVIHSMSLPGSDLVSPPTFLYTIVMTLLSVSGNLTHLMQIYESMQQQSIPMHTTTYTSIAHAHVQSGSIDAAIRILDTLLHQSQSTPSLVPTHRIFETIISRHLSRNDTRAAQSLIQTMIQHGVQPRSTTYMLIMTHLIQSRQWGIAVKLFDAMIQNGCTKIDVEVYSELIHGLCDVSYQFQSTEWTIPTQPSTTKQFDMYKQKLPGMPHTFYSGSHHPQGTTYHHIARIYSHYMQHMVQNHIHPSPTTQRIHSTLIRHLIHIGYIPATRDVFLNMIRLGHMPTTQTILDMITCQAYRPVHVGVSKVPHLPNMRIRDPAYGWNRLNWWSVRWWMNTIVRVVYGMNVAKHDGFDGGNGSTVVLSGLVHVPTETDSHQKQKQESFVKLACKTNYHGTWTSTSTTTQFMRMIVTTTLLSYAQYAFAYRLASVNGAAYPVTHSPDLDPISYHAATNTSVMTWTTETTSPQTMMRYFNHVLTLHAEHGIGMGVRFNKPTIMHNTVYYDLWKRYQEEDCGEYKVDVGDKYRSKFQKVLYTTTLSCTDNQNPNDIPISILTHPTPLMHDTLFVNNALDPKSHFSHFFRLFVRWCEEAGEWGLRECVLVWLVDVCMNAPEPPQDCFKRFKKRNNLNGSD